MWLDEENPQDPYNRANPAVTTPSVGAGGGTAQSGGTTSNPSTTTSVQSNQPKQEFGTVQDYLGTNQQQGETLGQQFTGKLGENLTGEKSAIDTSANQTKSDIAGGTVNYDPNLVSTAVSDPTKIAGNTDQLGSFLKQWNAAYSGPKSFETSANYTPAQNAASEAQTKQAEASTTGGQQQLLQDNFGVYGQGNKGLDQALLQSSSYFPKVQEQAKQFSSIPDYLKQQSTDLGNAATAAQAATNQTKANTQGAFTGSLTKFQNDLNARTTSAQTQAKTDAAQYQQDLASGDPTKIAADLKKSGVADDQIQNVVSYLQNLNKDYGTTPDLSGQYSFNPNVDINAGNVASAQDYANAAAYGKLTGVDYSGVLNPANAAQAGTAKTAITGFNPSGISSTLKGQLSDADTKLLSTPPDILKNITDAASTGKTVQQYLDAVQRSGRDIKSDPNIQKMIDDASQDQYRVLTNGGNASDPRIKADQAILTQIGSAAGAIPTSPPNGPGTTPIVGNPNGRPGTPTTTIDPTKLLKPTPVLGTPEQLGQKITQQIASSGAATPGRMQQTKADVESIQQLYQNYLDQKISATQYITLQNLLSKYNIKL